MSVDASFATPAAALAGFILSAAIERLLRPAPLLARPWKTWALHAALWCLPYGLLVLLAGRPWFAACCVLAFALMLTLVSNAKMKALQEPFIFQDYEYFIDTIRYPRLYIPFMGWGKFFAAALGFFLALCVGLWGEEAPDERFSWSVQGAGMAAVFFIGAAALFAGGRGGFSLSLNPSCDLRRLGLAASLWGYAMAERRLPTVAQPFASLPLRSASGQLPHLVAVQSESFFDPRALYNGIRKDVLAEYDSLRAEALAWGRLATPAWGANTVRTEFAFLSGMEERHLGVHRFNPYRALARGWEAASLASCLKTLGYRTVCVHPYPAAFYRRAKVFPKLGFDAFFDIGSFKGMPRFGPYVSDLAVAAKIAQLLEKTREPMFIFAVTMENHGPLSFERVEDADARELYDAAPPPGCEDLTVYLRHLKNADRTAGALRESLRNCARPAGLCWYGDHVPIMPAVYARLGTPREVDYAIWSSGGGEQRANKPMQSHELALEWLKAMGMAPTRKIEPES